MHYELTAKEPRQQFFKISLICTAPDDELVLTFPNWRPGRYQGAYFAKNIRDFKVTDDSGKSLTFKKISLNRWQIPTAEIEKVKVEYSYYSNDWNAGSTYLGDYFWYVNPVNCMIYDEDRMNEACSLSLVDLPKEYKIASSADFDQGKAFFESYHQLVDTPVIASSKLQHQSYESNGITFNVWFNGDIRVEWKRILNDFKLFTDHQIQEFTEFPGEQYHFLIHILPYKGYHGVEHLESTVITLGPTYDIFGKLYKELLGVSSHELYHCWNVKTIRPSGWIPYNYAEDVPSRMGYLAEGVTTYMGDVELLRSKVFDFDQYRQELEARINGHFHNYGRFNYSVSESSYDTWLDGYEIGIPHRKVSIYTEGSLLAFYTDVWIMQQTKHKKGLQEVMRRLFFNFGMKGKGVTEADYKKTIEDVAEADFTEIWENYFYGTGSYERLLADAFDILGLEMSKKPNKNWVKRHLGVLAAEKGKGVQIVRAAPGSRGELCGLIQGDQIVGVNGKKLENDIEQWIEYYQYDEIKLTVSRNNNLIDLTCPHVENDYFSEVTISRVDKPDKNQEVAFGRWSRTTKNM